MAAINDLLRQITDGPLRERLTQEFDRLSKNKKFGLVFEEHIPECTPLYGTHSPWHNRRIKKRVNDVYTVLKVSKTRLFAYARNRNIQIALSSWWLLPSSERPSFHTYAN